MSYFLRKVPAPAMPGGFAIMLVDASGEAVGRQRSVCIDGPQRVTVEFVFDGETLRYWPGPDQ